MRAEKKTRGEERKETAAPGKTEPGKAIRKMAVIPAEEKKRAPAGIMETETAAGRKTEMKAAAAETAEAPGTEPRAETAGTAAGREKPTALEETVDQKEAADLIPEEIPAKPEVKEEIPAETEMKEPERASAESAGPAAEAVDQAEEPAAPEAAAALAEAAVPEAEAAAPEAAVAPEEAAALAEEAAALAEAAVPEAAAAPAETAVRETPELRAVLRRLQTATPPARRLSSQACGEETLRDGGWKSRIGAIQETNGPESTGLSTVLTRKVT